MLIPNGLHKLKKVEALRTAFFRRKVPSEVNEKPNE
jgi:hypothetical protein